MSNPSQQQQQQPPSDDALLDQLISSWPTSSSSTSTAPGGTGTVGPVAPSKDVTVEDFQKVLDSTPLFMRETPKDGEENPILDALRSLVFEGEGDEIALNFKDHGNELHAQKSYSEAIKAYTEGVDAKPSSPSLLVTLLNNRAQCHLLLKNYGSVLKDAGKVIGLYSAHAQMAREGKKSGVKKEKKIEGEGEKKEKDDDADKEEITLLKSDKALVKALFRAAQSLVALSRWKEGSDVIARGQSLAVEVGENPSAWTKVSSDLQKGLKRDTDRAERIRRENLSKFALRRAVEERGLVVVDTPNPPDNPHPFKFDPEAIAALATAETEDQEAGWQPPPSHTSIIFPVFLLYPTYGQSDFITHFHEDTSFQDQLDVIFPKSKSQSNPQIPFAEWDTKQEYYTSNLVVYVETAQRRLLKVGKELTLREVLAKAKKAAVGDQKKDGVVLRDGLLSFVVLVKGTAEKAWIEDFKKKRDGK
ncbi:hypothetical protein CI109_101081 [Kwoniella shandongensis]|uniref:Uncharacterized protein n=1 Tax=Kwoniella shandongensis TaxID=1734106 RepID=A0A5M6C4X1_9TREE|nr:uncharacterized protein CI109_001550 [Kwoniella shandongensis]KAA5530144.1 hypothetical protein CI109_001550 [Kwoniella shandongensis]